MYAEDRQHERHPEAVVPPLAPVNVTNIPYSDTGRPRQEP
jgi:hypothetical protein